MNKVAELRGQSRGRLVAVLLGEARITADVRDQERADGCVWRGSQPSTESTPRGRSTQTARDSLRLPVRSSAAAANELAVASDAIGAVGVDEVASAAAGDCVACAVFGMDDVIAGPAEQPVSSTAGEEDVVVAEAVEAVRAAEAAKHVHPRRSAENIAAGRPCSRHLLRRRAARPASGRR